ncbi:TPA: hypothetical protein NKV74_001194 [Vibrio parahaemolyticus]|nr:hypothetical protein [Vibrio parahaemolyticus]
MEVTEFGLFESIWLCASWIMASIAAIAKIGIKPKIWEVFDQAFKAKLSAISALASALGFVALWYYATVIQILSINCLFILSGVTLFILLIGVFLFEYFNSHLVCTKFVVVAGKTPEENTSKLVPFIRGWWMTKPAKANFEKAREKKPSITMPQFVDGCGNDELSIFSELSLACGRFSFYLMHIILVSSGIILLCMLSLVVYLVTQTPQ